jgi:hypothetical protein
LSLEKIWRIAVNSKNTFSLKLQLAIAQLIKSLWLPHIFKYIAMLMVKNKNIECIGVLKNSKYKMKLNIGDATQFWIWMNGGFESADVNYVLSQSIDQTFLDIGANVGPFALEVCSKAKMVYAFEPLMSNCRGLCHSIAWMLCHAKTLSGGEFCGSSTGAN